ncbi:acyltransferase family protein [Rhizorhabdus argentea]|uniref:acyltransferase family protein n=1 Tax=Rhizorhabdus argentea TaxID=1387174 RepID=UPI0030EF2458
MATNAEHSISTSTVADSLAKLEARTGSAEFNVAAHGLRGVASVLVLAAHIAGGTARHIYAADADYVSLVEHPWYLGTFGVEIFFVISGFVILPSVMKYNLGEFALRRFVRIYPLFFMLSLVFVALNAVTDAYPKLNDLPTVIAGFLFVNLFTGTEQLTPNAWSLSFEICFYALTALVVTCAVKRRSAVAGALAIGTALAFLIAFPITCYFIIGLVLRLTFRAEQKATATSRVAEAASLALVIWFASRAHFDYTAWSQFQDPVVLPIVVSLGCYFYLALRQGSLTAGALDRAVFRYIGTVSYSLYLVHPFAYFALRAIFVRSGLFTDNIALSMALFATAVFAASFLLTHFAHALFERWPYQRVFHQAVYREKPATSAAAVAR